MCVNDNHGKYNKIEKGKIDFYFNELSKELRKQLGRNVSVEMIVVGGASILINYDFRDNTGDIDAIIASNVSIKDTINRIGDKYHLENGWINSDFKKTASYSPKLVACSKYYKTYNHILTVRTINQEYLVAMKLASLRQYKNDLSDIIGIIHSEKGKSISFEKIDVAVLELYGGWHNMPDNAKIFIKSILNNTNKNLYESQCKEEKQNKDILSEFEEKYEGILNENNLDDILDTIKSKKSQGSVLAKLHQNQRIIDSQNKNERHINEKSVHEYYSRDKGR